MILTLLIVMFLINFIPFLIYYKQYKDLKKRNAGDRQYDKLAGRMMKASGFIMPAMLIIVVLVYIQQ
ncbi:hypothetical protein HNR44_002994 [Geomicrobium halophilum]|uniref:Uncharacterized protein n=1 Tax=Geomicrobium halophilum TaxID=549000 RepID=A0A841PTA6_9BACL|nr:hypothetical protein [Geomicrobium halophilum]